MIFGWKLEALSREFYRNKNRYLAISRFWRSDGYVGDADYLNDLVLKTELFICDLNHKFCNQSLGIFKKAVFVKQLSSLCRELREGVKPIWRQLFETALIVGFIVLSLRTFVFGLYQNPTGSGEPTLLVGDRIFANKLIYRFRKIKRGDLIVFDDPESETNINFGSAKLNKFGRKLKLPRSSDAWIKRIVALPGDSIEGRIENERAIMYLNGELLNEPYVNTFPLVEVAKEVGFENKFLNTYSKKKRGLFYSYDPDKPLYWQPFYSFNKNEINIDQTTKLPVLNCQVAIKELDEFKFIVPENKYWVMGDSRINSGDSRAWGFLDESLICGRAELILFSVDSEEPWFLMEFVKNPIQFFIHKVRWKRVLRRLHPFKGLPTT
jgi:signal peptidase I